MSNEWGSPARDLFHMETATQYREFAEKCDRLVEETNDPRHKRMLQEMAQAWRKLADEDERKKN